MIAAVVLAGHRRVPRQLYNIVLGMNRWVLRVAAYAGLMTDKYPPFRLDIGGPDPGTLTCRRRRGPALAKMAGGPPAAGTARGAPPSRTQERQDAERQALGEAWREHGLVFASSIGTPVEPRNVNRRWDELRRRAGLDWLRLHDLRHGCATLLLAKGVPDRVIMEVLGHAEIGVTMNTYAHVLPVLRQEAADAMDELFGG